MNLKNYGIVLISGDFIDFITPVITVCVASTHGFAPRTFPTGHPRRVERHQRIKLIIFGINN